MSDHLRTSDYDGTRVLTIDRPESKNALHGPLRAALREAMAAADRDDTVRVVVLTGVDPVFSAGG
jgi:enoyl-CoA hydratase